MIANMKLKCSEIIIHKKRKAERTCLCVQSSSTQGTFGPKCSELTVERHTPKSTFRHLNKWSDFQKTQSPAMPIVSKLGMLRGLTWVIPSPTLPPVIWILASISIQRFILRATSQAISPSGSHVLSQCCNVWVTNATRELLFNFFFK